MLWKYPVIWTLKAFWSYPGFLFCLGGGSCYLLGMVNHSISLIEFWIHYSFVYFLYVTAVLTQIPLFAGHWYGCGVGCCQYPWAATNLQRGSWGKKLALITKSSGGCHVMPFKYQKCLLLRCVARSILIICFEFWPVLTSLNWQMAKISFCQQKCQPCSKWNPWILNEQTCK